MRHKLLQSHNALLSPRKSGFGKTREKVQLSPWSGVQNAVRPLKKLPPPKKICFSVGQLVA